MPPTAALPKGVLFAGDGSCSKGKSRGQHPTTRWTAAVHNDRAGWIKVCRRCHRVWWRQAESSAGRRDNAKGPPIKRELTPQQRRYRRERGENRRWAAKSGPVRVIRPGDG